MPLDCDGAERNGGERDLQARLVTGVADRDAVAIATGVVIVRRFDLFGVDSG